MDSSVCITAIKLRMKNELGYDLSQAAKGSPLDIMVEEIIKHIQSTAVVTIPSVAGVTPGGGVSGPGVGTIA